jgi:hypothetical protein
MVLKGGRKIEDSFVNLAEFKKIYFLLAWLLVSIVLPIIVSLFSTPIFNVRYAIAASLPFYFLVAKGIDNIGINVLKYLIYVVMLVLFSINIWNYFSLPQKEQWREVSEYIDANGEQDDLLIFNSGFCKTNVFEYYSKRQDFVKLKFPEDKKETPKENIHKLENYIEGHDRIWLILSHSNDKEGVIMKELNKSFKLLESKKNIGIEIYQFVGN